MAPVIPSVRDPALSATLVSRMVLHYAAGADAALDRPAHVRAGSSLARFGQRLAVIQDDANFIALADPATGQADALPLPAGPGGLRQFDDRRGNKPDKLDLEACFTASGDSLVALGSGSSPQRESLVVLTPDGHAQTVAAHGLYACLREAKDFSGSELNIEGALFIDGRVRLFNRGNGAWRDGLAPVNASCDIVWPEFEACLRGGLARPVLDSIQQYRLGGLDGAPLSFTDVADTEYGVLFTATAENSSDAVTDGAVSGSVVGVFGNPCRWIEVREGGGSLFADKIEGICAVGGRVYAVVDADDASRPSELCEIVLGGPWRTASALPG